MTEYTLSSLAERLGLTLKGEDAVVSGLNTLEAAGPTEISFLANPKYAHFLPDTRALAVIISAEHADKVQRALISDNPYRDFGRALALFARPEGSFSGISDLAFIHPEACLAPDCTVYPFAYVGARAQVGEGCTLFPGVYIGEDARIGSGCTLYPNAVVMSRVVLGKRCVLHPGVVLGAEGFGFTRTPAGIQKIPQAGFVSLDDGVEIGANSAVDRGALGPTSIGGNTKMDNLVQIGHNVTLGKENLIVSQVGISGSTRTGDRVTIAGQAGLAGHLKVGDDAVIGPQAGVAKDVPDNFNGSGSPLVDGQTFLRTLNVMPKLPDIYRRFKKLEKEVAALRSELAGTGPTDDKERK